MVPKMHKPNVIPAKARVALVIVAAFLILFMCAAAATGYFYLPGKRGGFLLSGFPTLLIVLAASGLFLAALLTIIDHYDRRPNEASYSRLRTYCLRGALYLFIAAPIVELAQRLLLLWNIDIFPRIDGLAGSYTFYTPELRGLLQYVEPITSHWWLLGLLSFATGGLGLLIDKRCSGLQRVVAVLFSISMLSLSTLFLASSTRDFFLGQINDGQSSHKHIIRAINEPAKFNAILLTHFVLGGVMFTASAFVFVAAITDRLKIPHAPRAKTAKKREALRE